MAAPTPVSALLHAATIMVSGIFFILRLTTVVHWQVSFIGLLGGFTLLWGGVAAVYATDMKKTIA